VGLDLNSLYVHACGVSAHRNKGNVHASDSLRLQSGHKLVSVAAASLLCSRHSSRRGHNDYQSTTYAHIHGPSDLRQLIRFAGYNLKACELLADTSAAGPLQPEHEPFVSNQGQYTCSQACIVVCWCVLNAILCPHCCAFLKCKVFRAQAHELCQHLAHFWFVLIPKRCICMLGFGLANNSSVCVAPAGTCVKADRRAV
jgi:hypothetical protein